jgi:hypothetical protein
MRGRSARIARPAGWLCMRASMLLSAAVPVVSPSAATRSARRGLRRQSEQFRQWRLKIQASYTDGRGGGAAHLRLAPMAEKTATAAFCAPDSGTWLGYRRPGARAGAVCDRPDVEGDSRSTSAAVNAKFQVLLRP